MHRGLPSSRLGRLPHAGRLGRSGRPGLRPGLGLGLAITIAAGGCVANGGDEGILVLKNVAGSDMCVFSASESELGIGHGSLDVLLRRGYLFGAQLKSRITALAGQEDQRTIITRSAKIDIAFPGSTLFSDAELEDLRSRGLTHFKQLFSVPIAPNGGITDAPFILVPGELSAAILDKAGTSKPFSLEAIATFSIEGNMSGETVTSQPFSYPLTIGSSIGVNDAGTCPLPKSFGTVRAGYACNAAQDGIVDCCHDASNGSLTCPATISTM
jgi:hypothetical protein